MTDTGAQPPATEPEGEGLVETIRSVVGEALGELFDSGKADVAEGGAKAEKADKPLTAADVQRIAAEEMGKAQDALRAKRAAKSQAAAKPSPQGGAAPTAAAPAPHVRGWWERLQHGIWGEKD